MDPTAALDEIRALIADHRQPIDVARLAELVGALAERLHEAGCPPRQWTHPAEYPQQDTGEWHRAMTGVVVDPAGALVRLQRLCYWAEPPLRRIIPLMAGLDLAAVLHPDRMPPAWGIPVPGEGVQ